MSTFREDSIHVMRELRAERKINDLKAENEKLRQEIAKARDPQRIGGQADPSSFVYAIEQLREFRWQHATNDEDAIPYINNVAAAHERESAKLRKQVANLIDCSFRMADKIDCVNSENAKLRELVRTLYMCSHVRCDQCEYEHEGACAFDAEEELRELGVEV